MHKMINIVQDQLAGVWPADFSMANWPGVYRNHGSPTQSGSHKHTRVQDHLPSDQRQAITRSRSTIFSLMNIPNPFPYKKLPNSRLVKRLHATIGGHCVHHPRGQRGYHEQVRLICILLDALFRHRTKHAQSTEIPSTYTQKEAVVSCSDESPPE